MFRFAWSHKWLPVKLVDWLIALNTAGTMLWLVSPQISNKTGINPRPVMEKALDIEGVVFNTAYDVTSSLAGATSTVLSSSKSWENLVLASAVVLVLGWSVWKWRGRRINALALSHSDFKDSLWKLLPHMPHSMYLAPEDLQGIMRLADKECAQRIDSAMKLGRTTAEKKILQLGQDLVSRFGKSMENETQWSENCRLTAVKILEEVLVVS